MKALFVMKR